MLFISDSFFNWSFPRYKNSHFQNEAMYKAFVVKMSFICMRMKNHFHINGLVLSLASKKRLWAARKWPMVSRYENSINLSPFIYQDHDMINIALITFISSTTSLHLGVAVMEPKMKRGVQ